MRNGVICFFVVAAVFEMSGCSKQPKLWKAKGQVVKNGEDFIPEDEENLQIALVPIQENLSPAKNWYYAEVDQAKGTFFAAGGEKKGVPPGKYRVLVELKKDKKDVLKGKFFNLESTFVFEIDDRSETMIVDIGTSPAKT